MYKEYIRNPAKLSDVVQKRLKEKGVNKITQASYQKSVMNEWYSDHWDNDIQRYSRRDQYDVVNDVETHDSESNVDDIEGGSYSTPPNPYGGDEEDYDDEYDEEDYENANVAESDESDTYKKVFNGIAKHLKIDPKKVDDADEKTKKKFYQLLDRCWDADDDKVPDSCPVDLHYLNEEELSEEQIVENIESELKQAVKSDDVVEIEFEDGDTFDIDPETAKDILDNSKARDLMKSAKNKHTFLNFLNKILR